MFEDSHYKPMIDELARSGKYAAFQVEDDSLRWPGQTSRNRSARTLNRTELGGSASYRDITQSRNEAGCARSDAWFPLDIFQFEKYSR